MNSYYIPSTWKRLIARGIDSIIGTLLYFPFFKSLLLLVFTDQDVTISLSSLLIMFLIPAIYEFIFLVLMQATPGKWLMGLKVVPFHDVSGHLDWRQCLMRPLVERLSLFFSLAIYALAFFRYDRTHLADWIAETRVVQGTPRPTRTKIRWFIGSILILMNFSEGLRSSSHILSVIDWSSGQVELRALLDSGSVEEEPEE
ncbi:MAG: RDD family protein [Bdellovibrio sp.]